MGEREQAELARLQAAYPKGAPEADLKGFAGVLPGHMIEEACASSEAPLIDSESFEKRHVRAAAYQLTVGDAYKDSDGNIVDLLDDGTVTIPPYGAVVIQTAETLCIPRNIIARWNVRASLAYRGMVWVGAPQVDPGWIGHLFAPVYNLSNEPLILRRSDRFATIDFVTTSPNEGDDKYKSGPKGGHVSLESYKAPDTGLRAALEGLEERERAWQVILDQREARLNRAEQNLGGLAVITLAVITLMFTAVSNTIFQEAELFGWENVDRLLILVVLLVILLTAYTLYLSIRTKNIAAALEKPEEN